MLYSLRDLNYDYQWAGTRLQNLHIRVCFKCADVPQEQLRSIVLPADPVPVKDPRPEYYGIEVTSFLADPNGPSLLTEGGSALIWEIDVTPGVNDRLPSYIYPDPPPKLHLLRLRLPALADSSSIPLLIPSISPSWEVSVDGSACLSIHWWNCGFCHNG